MPSNYGMFLRRADQDPEASQKRGLSKMVAGWKLMLGDDKNALNGTTSTQDWAAERSSLGEHHSEHDSEPR